MTLNVVGSTHLQISRRPEPAGHSLGPDRRSHYTSRAIHALQHKFSEDNRKSSRRGETNLKRHRLGRHPQPSAHHCAISGNIRPFPASVVVRAAVAHVSSDAHLMVPPSAADQHPGQKIQAHAPGGMAHRAALVSAISPGEISSELVIDLSGNAGAVCLAASCAGLGCEALTCCAGSLKRCKAYSCGALLLRRARAALMRMAGAGTALDSLRSHQNVHCVRGSWCVHPSHELGRSEPAVQRMHGGHSPTSSCPE